LEQREADWLTSGLVSCFFIAVLYLTRPSISLRA
jgi:hypothetical protein